MAIPISIHRLSLTACLFLALASTAQAQIFTPNLKANSLAYSTYSWKAGDIVAFTGVYSNTILLLGNAGPHRVGFYFSTDSTITTADTLMYYYTATGLASGYKRTLNGSVRIPYSTTPNGWKYGGMYVDDKFQVKETSEADNAIARPVSYLSGRDLQVSGYFIPTTARAGSTVTVGAQVYNTGHLSAGPFYTAFFLSSNSTITHGDDYLGAFYTGSLGANKSTGWKYINVRIPSVPTYGTWYIGIEADATYKVSEKIETNNILSIARTITAPVSSARWLEYRHFLQTSSAPTYMSTSQYNAVGYAQRGGSVDMRVTAPALAGGLQICVWSAKSPWVYDYTSSFCLGLMNNPALFPGWFSTLDSKGMAMPRFNFPKGSPIHGSLNVYTQSFLFNNYFQFVGTTGLVRTTLHG